VDLKVTMPDLDDAARLPDGACAKLVCGAANWAAEAGRRCAKMIVKAEDEDGNGPAYQAYGKPLLKREPDVPRDM
jgi:hypothetical protein